MTELLKINKKINFKIEKKIKETSYLKLISSKSKKKLGWKPKYSLKEGLTKTIEWYISSHKATGNVENNLLLEHS